MVYSYYKVGIFMKKLFCLVVLGGFLLICSGCQGNITRDIRHAGFSMGNEFLCSKFYPQDKGDTNYSKIRYFTSSNLIDEDGKIYEISLGQNFSNDDNCREAETDIKVVAIYDDKIIKGSDQKYYYLTSSNNVPSYSLVPTTDNSYIIYDLLLKDNGVVKVVTANSSTGTYYVLKTDGNVYSYTISKKDYNSIPVVTSVSVVYDKNEYGANIIDFNYAGESLNTFIRTEDKVFRMKITNSKECQKYVDVSCIYKMSEDEIFTTYKDVIISFNGNTLLTNYKRMFTVAS